MFKIGVNYKFHTLESGDEVTFWGTIEKYEHPLIKLEDTQMPDINIITHETGDIAQTIKGDGLVYPGRIINVTSPNFISAEEQTD